MIIKLINKNGGVHLVNTGDVPFKMNVLEATCCGKPPRVQAFTQSNSTQLIDKEIEGRLEVIDDKGNAVLIVTAEELRKSLVKEVG